MKSYRPEKVVAERPFSYKIWQRGERESMISTVRRKTQVTIECDKAGGSIPSVASN